ncbi:unnamed protein product [Rotaria sp. Silwood2]|nr:unnamed protein product [Rotaria sp. Silwood2]
MTTGPTSTALVDNVHRLLSVYVPNNSRDTYKNLLASMNVKSHGKITFSDYKSHQADFIRIPNDAPVMQVQELLNRHWCGGRPSLVISITGGAKEYNMKPRLLRAFRRGLLKVARTTGAWIITGGMNTGIMKLVGEIVQINPDRSRPIPLIGIATWGCVSGREDLEVNGVSVPYTKTRSNNTRGEAPLEPNHTQFIFIDDESVKKYGREIAFRAKLEQAISGGFFSSKTTTNSVNQYASLCTTSSLRPENSAPVPVVLLVVEGGPNTVRTVKEAVVENNIPAVFLEGTGRCCDLFAKAYRLYNEYRKKIEPDDEIAANIDPNILKKRYDDLKSKLREELKDELRAISGSTDTPNPTDNKARSIDTTDYFQLVYDCVHTRTNFLNVISLNSRHTGEPDIDLVILQALLNATSDSHGGKSVQRKREQLQLALEWNRVDIAKHVIMKNEADWNIDLNDLFLLALRRNQVEFVKLFLDHDFSLTVLFRDINKLLTLQTYIFLLGAALIATLIYKRHARTENDHGYNQSADEFENLAVQILEKFYQANPKACLKAIIRQIPAYGNATWLEFAVAADAKQFIAHRAVQDLFNDIWFGYINEATTHFTIVFSTFMLWFSGFLGYNKYLVTADDKTELDDSINKSHCFERQTSKQKRIEDRKRSRISQYFFNIITFVRAPYVKYLYNLYAHLIFLLLFSYVILCDFFPLYNFGTDTCAPSSNSVNYKDSTADKDDNGPLTSHTLTESSSNATKSVPYGFQKRNQPSITEIILVVWVITLVCEEVRQLISIEAQSIRNVFTAYFKSFWNKLDVLAIFLFFLGIALRYIPTSECYCAARIVLSFDLSIWFIRTLDMFAAVKRLGPKLVMIGEMVNNLINFIKHDLKGMLKYIG